jgi:hypothetical protein
MGKIEEIINDKSYLYGKPTSFKNISCRGAKFDSIKNTTGAKLPTEKELREDAPNNSSISKLFGFLGN